MSDVLIERARALARSLSEDLRVVGLLADVPDDPTSLEAVVELAAVLGRSRRTLLANLAGSASRLDVHLDIGDAEGLAAVLRGDATLGEVAVRPGTRPFLYLPSGNVSGFQSWLHRRDAGPRERAIAKPGGTEDSPLASLMERLTERIRSAEAILLLYVPPELARSDMMASFLDGVVSLSGSAAAEVRQTGLPVVGVQGPEAPAPTPASSGGEEDRPAVGEGDESGEPPPSTPEGPAPERPRWELEEADGEEETAAPESPPATEDVAGERDVPPDGGGAAVGGDVDDVDRPSTRGEPEPAPAGGAWGETARDEPPPSPSAPDEEPSGAGDRDGDGAPEPGTEGPENGERWRRHRRAGSPPWGRIAAGALVILALAAGWWVLARSSSDGSEAAGTGGDAATRAAPGEVAGDAPPAVAADSPRDTTGSAAGGEASPGAAATETGSVPPDSVIAASPELSHSVLVASYARLQQATARAEAWSGEDGILYFVAPTRIDGEVYHRVFSGALSSAASGRRAMERLVEMGRKDSVRVWDVRPSGLAYRLAATRDEAEATRVRDELASGGVPAYVLTAVADGDTVHQVYAGAYEDADQAALDDALRAMGRDVSLVRRRGAPRTP